MDSVARASPRLSKAARKAAHKSAQTVSTPAQTVPTPSTKKSQALLKGGKKTRSLEEGPCKTNKKRRSRPLAGSSKRVRATSVDPEDGAALLSPEDFRAQQGIALVGSAEAVAPIQTFDQLQKELGTSPLTGALRSFGYVRPTPIQAQSWPLALRGRDVVAIAATGSGKTCAYLVPALVRIAERGQSSPPRGPATAGPAEGSAPTGTWTCAKCGNVNWPQRTTCNTRSCQAPRPDTSEAEAPKRREGRPAEPTALVLAPARELAQQIHAEAQKLAETIAARVVCIYGGVPKGAQANALLDKGADLVIATPGRCLDFLQDDKLLGTPLCAKQVTYLVLDEADRMLEAGFLPEIEKIAAMCAPIKGRKSTKKRQTLLFTATWPLAVQQAARGLTAATAAEVRVGQRSTGELCASSAVAQRTEVLETHRAKLGRLVEVVGSDLAVGSSCLLFCKTKKRCDWLVKQLSSELGGTWVQALHSGKDQREREETLESFRARTAQGGKEKTMLVATNVASRGLHIPEVPLVVVYDFSSIGDYVHQVGRTGRCGASGRAVTFYVAGDGNAQELVDVLRQAEQTVPPALVAIADAEGPAASDSLDGNAAKARQGWRDQQWARQCATGERRRRRNTA